MSLEKWMSYGEGYCISCRYCMDATGKDDMDEMCIGCHFTDDKINWEQRTLS